MKLKFEMKVRCMRARTAAKLAEVLEPDNRSIPSDQRFSMSRLGKTLVFKVESARAPSALASVASLLNDIHLFKEVWLLST